MADVPKLRRIDFEELDALAGQLWEQFNKQCDLVCALGQLDKGEGGNVEEGEDCHTIEQLEASGFFQFADKLVAIMCPIPGMVNQGPLSLGLATMLIVGFREGLSAGAVDGTLTDDDITRLLS